MYKFENEAYTKKLNECIAEYEIYRKMMLEPVDFTNPQALIQRLQTITAHNAWVGRVKASFDFLIDKAVASEMRKIDHDSMPAKRYDAMVKDGVGLIVVFPKALEIMIKESHYAIEAIRSALSYSKKEMETLNY